MGQTWTDLLFAHWSVAPETLAGVVPEQLALDTYDGRAWIGVTPFAVRNLRVRLTLPVPSISTFPEINVRTYVSVDNKPGIFFFSLDADSHAAVSAARRLYRLPYFHSRIAIARDGPEVRYDATRADADAPADASFRGSYRPVGARFQPPVGTLAHWLLERYCLYTLDDQQRVRRAEIHHPRWPVQRAQATIETNTMAAELGLALEDDPLLHYARRQDVVFWALERV